jgi:hypothetical protein
MPKNAMKNLISHSLIHFVLQRTQTWGTDSKFPRIIFQLYSSSSKIILKVYFQKPTCIFDLLAIICRLHNCEKPF